MNPDLTEPKHFHPLMVSVFDAGGNYLGCMGRNTWDWTLTVDNPRKAVEDAEHMQEEHLQWAMRERGRRIDAEDRLDRIRKALR